MSSESTLTYQVYVAPIIAMAGKDVPPGQSRSTWSPISAILISGRHDAVLADPLMAMYPHRVNPGALWLSAQSAKAGAEGR